MTQSPIILSSSVTTASDKAIDKLFTRFAAIYGHIWKSLFKSEKFSDFAKKEWMEALKGFSDTIIDRAIDICREFHDMPPTLPQMIRCCRSVVNRQFIRLEPAPHKPARKEIVEMHIKRCRQSLN